MPPIELVLAVLALALVLLAIGLRGRLVDRDPRCRARRCRYPLRDLLEAKRSANEPAWPITCPECGRVMESESRTRRGARRKMRPLVALGVALALPPIALLGFEGYARWQGTRAVATMPLWLLLRQAERDTGANGWIHQRELFDRVMSGAIGASDAPRVIERILRWQADPRVGYGYAGDALVEFAALGLLTREQQNRAWANQHHFELLLPDSVEPGGPLPIAVRVHPRRGELGRLPVIDPHPWSGAARFDGGAMTGVRVVQMRIGRVVVPLAPDRAALRGLAHMPDRRWRVIDHGWRPATSGWPAPLAPDGEPGADVDVEIDIEWDLSGSQMFGLHQDPEQHGRWVAPDQWFAHRGIPTTGRATVRAQTRLAARGSVVHAASTDPLFERWLHDKFAECKISVTHQPTGWHGINITPFFRLDLSTLPADPPVVFGEYHLVRGDWRLQIASVAHAVESGSIGHGDIAPDLRLAIIHAVTLQPGGWEVEFTPRPEWATQTVERPVAWGGPPIRVPIGSEITILCPDGSRETLRFDPHGTLVGID